jgi:hypothetical protein
MCALPAGGHPNAQGLVGQPREPASALGQHPREGLPAVQLRAGAGTLALSRLGLGTHGVHRLLRASARQGLLAHAFELGIRYFDTAPSYGNGLAEREIGRFARGRRSDIIIATKFGIPVSRAASRLPGMLYATKAAGVIARKLGVGSGGATRDFSAAAASRSLEQSLRELRTAYVDILYLHEPHLSSLHDAESLVATLESLRASGKLRHVGLSGSLRACAEIARAYPALAEILQLEVPADSQGLPEPDAPPPQEAAVRFFEFPKAKGPPPALTLVMHRLRSVAREGVILLSTRSRAQLEQAVQFILKHESRP